MSRAFNTRLFYEGMDSLSIEYQKNESGYKPDFPGLNMILIHKANLVAILWKVLLSFTFFYVETSFVSYLEGLIFFIEG